LIFKEAAFEKNELKAFTGLASPYEKAGDAILTYFSSKLSTLCVLDGVSSSKSPSESSKLCKVKLKEFFKSKRAFKIDEYTDELSALNKEMIDKGFASTLSQVVLTEEHVFAFTVGDSQVFLYDHDDHPIYESWPQNVGFSNGKDNPSANIILNWIGNDHLRLEMVQFDKSKVKTGLIISDGILDFLEVSKQPLSGLRKSLLENFAPLSATNLLDDSSFVYFEV
jgi:serine/threonine protein phosphatase PrpC